MAIPSRGKSIESALPIVQQQGLNTQKASNLAGFLVDTSGNVIAPGTFTGAGVITGLRPVVSSAAVGATVALTAAQSGGVFINASTSGSPSWTLPTAALGLNYTFITGNTTTGFTITGAQVIHFKTSASGTVLTSTTTLTNTQGTAIVGDTISLVSDGTSWYMTAISGIFAAS